MSVDYSTQRVVAFDTLKYVKRLKEAGVSERQAEAEAEALAEVLTVHLGELATRRDLQDLAAATRHDLQDLAAATRRDLQDLAATTQRDLKDLETRLVGRIDTLKAELGGRIDTLGAELRYIKWLGGVILGALVALLVKAFWA
jgi:hypothetical protein